MPEHLLDFPKSENYTFMGLKRYDFPCAKKYTFMDLNDVRSISDEVGMKIKENKEIVRHGDHRPDQLRELRQRSCLTLAVENKGVNFDT